MKALELLAELDRRDEHEWQPLDPAQHFEEVYADDVKRLTALINLYAHAFARAEHDARTRDQMESAFGAVLSAKP